MKTFFIFSIQFFLECLFSFFLFIEAIFCRKRAKKSLIFGTAPLLNSRYWGEALKEGGLPAETFVYKPRKLYSVNDFDKYIDLCFPLHIRFFQAHFDAYWAMRYIIGKARVFHTAYDNNLFHAPLLWRLEIFLLKIANVKIVIIPYGGGAMMYSRIADLTYRASLIGYYPQQSKKERAIEKIIFFKNRWVDTVITGGHTDGMGRFECVTPQLCQIDLKQWSPKMSYSKHDGLNGKVVVIHTPNHRLIKGTEFIINAVESLQKEGLQVKLELVENKTNEEVRTLFQHVDILAEQIIGPCYGLSGVEGLASGLVCLANFTRDDLFQIFRRYSFLNECPILSTSPENIKTHLRILVKNPKLREELGRASRAYAEKYHSYETARYMFGQIYDKILYRKDVNLMHMFHPLLSPYNKSKPFIKHPLENSLLPKIYYEEDAKQQR